MLELERRVIAHSTAKNSLSVNVPYEIARKLQLKKGDYLAWRDDNGHYCVVKREKRE